MVENFALEIVMFFPSPWKVSFRMAPSLPVMASLLFELTTMRKVFVFSLMRRQEALCSSTRSVRVTLEMESPVSKVTSIWKATYSLMFVSRISLPTTWRYSPATSLWGRLSSSDSEYTYVRVFPSA